MSANDDSQSGKRSGADRPGGEKAPSEGISRVHRRGFFVEGFRNLLKPLANIAERRLDRVGLPDWDEYKRRHPPGSSRASPERTLPRAPLPDRPVLRPPGALAEATFLDTCLTSGQCVSSCPVSAIKWAIDDDPRRDGKPFIDAHDQACVVCEDLSCMRACPSGALTPVPKAAIRMGLAVVDDAVCVRTQGEDCQICVDKCPIGVDAISIAYYGSPIDVHESGCVGCGVCEMYCPTSPRAIVVRPIDLIEADRVARESAERERPPDDDAPSVSGTYLPMD